MPRCSVTCSLLAPAIGKSRIDCVSDQLNVSRRIPSSRAELACAIRQLLQLADQVSAFRDLLAALNIPRSETSRGWVADVHDEATTRKVEELVTASLRDLQELSEGIRAGLQACYGKSPGNGAFSIDPIRRRLVRLTPRRADCGLRGTARRGRPAWPRGLCRLRVAPHGEP